MAAHQRSDRRRDDLYGGGLRKGGIYQRTFHCSCREKRTAFLELRHVLLSAQIKIGHATVWMRIRVCVSFILRHSLLPFGFAAWFARILRETFTRLLTQTATGSVSLCEPDELLTAFVELQRAIHAFAVSFMV